MSLTVMYEQAALFIEPHLYLAAARMRHPSLPELRVVYPLAFGVNLFRRVGAQRPTGRVSCRPGRCPAPARRASRRRADGRLLLLVEAVLSAAGAADDCGGDAVRIQGDDLMRAFGFAPSAVCVRVVAGANFLDSQGCVHDGYESSRAPLCEPCARAAFASC